MIGLSPRGRGNRRCIRDANPTLTFCPVYPRVGGATLIVNVYDMTCSSWGLSPRGRGNPKRPDLMMSAVDPVGVYPRVGGATRINMHTAVSSRKGLSPRGRGNLPSRPVPE